MSNSTNSRQIIFIEKVFQGKSIAIVVSIIFATGAISSLLLYFLLSAELGAEIKVAHHQIQNVWDRLAPTVFIANGVTVALTGIAAAFAVLYQSHKIAGPMYRLQQICKEVIKGNLNPVTGLRKSDQLMPLAEVFSHMVEALKVDHDARQQALSNALGLVNSLSESNDEQDKEKLVKELELALKEMKG